MAGDCVYAHKHTHTYTHTHTDSTTEDRLARREIRVCTRIRKHGGRLCICTHTHTHTHTHTDSATEERLARREICETWREIVHMHTQTYTYTHTNSATEERLARREIRGDAAPTLPKADSDLPHGGVAEVHFVLMYLRCVCSVSQCTVMRVL